MVLRLVFDTLQDVTGRDALIGKVGPTPRDVTLSVFCLVLSCSSLADNSHRFPPDKEPWPAYTACELVVARTSVSSSADGQHGTFSFPDFPVRMMGAFGDGGKWVCELSQLQERRTLLCWYVCEFRIARGRIFFLYTSFPAICIRSNHTVPPTYAHDPRIVATRAQRVLFVVGRGGQTRLLRLSRNCTAFAFQAVTSSSDSTQS